MKCKKKFESIDEYIASFPLNVQTKLEELRRVIREAAPKATEAISYGMPAFKLNGNLVYFAGWKSHIGFYGGTGKVVDAFKEDLAGYEVSKGTIKFPLDKPIPVALVQKIVRYRVDENMKKKRKY